MKSPSTIRWQVVVLLFSMAINVVLISTVIRRHLTPASEVSLTLTPASPDFRKTQIDSPLRQVRTPVYVTNAASSPALCWTNIESPDYKQYAANLRAAGVPDQVVKDILTADIGKIFGARVAAIRGPDRQPKYWQRQRSSDLTPEQMTQMKALDVERRAALKAVLGQEVFAQSVIDELLLQTRGDSSKTAFLPEEKRQAARAAIQRANNQFEQSVDDAQDYSKRRREQERLQMTELAKVLTPEELDDYKHRSSDTADRVRGELRDFQVTPDEFRALVQVRQALDDQSKGRGNYQDYQKRQAEEITRVLGPERGTEYLRATDFAWVNAQQIAEREGLPAGTADKVYAVKQSIDAALDQIWTDNTLDATQRRVRVEGVKSAAEQNVRAILGDSGFKRYQWRGGNWMGNIR